MGKKIYRAMIQRSVISSTLKMVIFTVTTVFNFLLVDCSEAGEACCLCRPLFRPREPSQVLSERFPAFSWPLHMSGNPLLKTVSVHFQRICNSVSRVCRLFSLRFTTWVFRQKTAIALDFAVYLQKTCKGHCFWIRGPLLSHRCAKTILITYQYKNCLTTSMKVLSEIAR